jgi:hypothetical protein
LPGTYTAKLTANGVSQTTSLTITMDPRVKASPADLAQQFEMETELASMLARSTKAIRQARSVREQIEKLSSQPGGPLPVARRVLDKKVSDALGSEQPDENAGALDPVNRKVSALYLDVDSADAAPTAAQQAALAVIRSDFSRALERWNAVIEDISGLNIRLDEKPSTDSAEYDEDLE